MKLFLSFVLLTSQSAIGWGVTLNIAAASDLKFALEEVVKRYQAIEPHTTCSVTFGSSGNFYSQLAQGAPFDLFLSADPEYPQKLARAGIADARTLFVYGTGHLAVWTRHDGVDLEKTGLAGLTNKAFARIAIAHPDHAPYGKAAVEALKKAGLWESVQPRLVRGENAAQAAQFAYSGAADAAIVSLSLARSAPMSQGRIYPVPSTLYRPLEQTGIILSQTQKRMAAEEFIVFLRSPASGEILNRFGITTGK